MQRRSRVKNVLSIVVLVLLVSALAFVAAGYREARSDPIVRHFAMRDGDWPRGVPPMRILLMSDMHALSPAMPPSRLSRIVAEANGLHPDVVVLAGDFLVNSRFSTGHHDVRRAVEPLQGLRPRLQTFAVMGNNDREYSRAEIREALEEAGITVLENDAVQLGPVALGGVDTRIRTTVRRLLALKGLKIIVSHSPDLFPRVPDGISLMLAGHTHCGQIVLPSIGPIATGSHFGSRYLCGIHREGLRTLIVTAGTGTSKVPLRIGAPPDIWLITIGR